MTPYELQFTLWVMAPVTLSFFTGYYLAKLISKLKGLTKREHFAGLAMQALLSNGVMGDSDGKLHKNGLSK